MRVLESQANEPVENPSIEWKTQFSKLATISIPQQEFSTDEMDTFAEHLSFSPWHSLQEHAPLGGINRARKVIYQASANKRHEKNQQPMQEPTLADVPGEWPNS